MLKHLRQLNKKLLLIVGLALLIRLIGLNHGFPFIYHVDEPALFRTAYNIRFDPNPHHFDWPHFHSYLNFFLYGVIYVFRGVLQVLGLKDFVSGFFPLLWTDQLIFYIATRAFNALLGALTCIPIYLIGKRLFNPSVGLLGALTLALFPYHVWQSHFALLDVAMTFWFTISAYFSIKVALEGNKKDYFLAALFAGLATSTKYNGAFGVIFLIFCHFMYLWNTKFFELRNLTKKTIFQTRTFYMFLAGLFSIFIFFTTTPFAFFDYKTFSRDDGPKGAFWQFKNVGKVDSNEYVDQLSTALTTKFLDDFGYAYMIIFQIYFVYFVFSNKTKSKILIAFPAFFYFLYITSFDKNRIHYYMLCFPFISLMIAHFTLLSRDFLLERYPSFMKNKILLEVVFLIVVFALPIYYNLKNLNILLNKDTRNIAYEWLIQNNPEQSFVIYSGGDLEPMMTELPFEVKKTSVLTPSIKKRIPKYWVVSTKAPIESLDIYEDLSEKGILQLKVLSSGNSTGPDVYVYLLNYAEEPINAQ